MCVIFLGFCEEDTLHTKIWGDHHVGHHLQKKKTRNEHSAGIHTNTLTQAHLV